MAENPKEGNFDEKPPVNVEQYDKSIRFFCGAYEEIFKMVHSCLRARMPENSRLLIAGAGSGMEILSFAPHQPGWSFCGVDPSGDMLALTEKKLADAKLPNRIDLIKGYVEELPDEACFDGATLILVMHFIKDDQDKRALLTSISRRLKPGAPFVLVDGCGEPGTAEFETVLKAWKQYPQIHGVSPETVESAFSDVILKMIHFVPESHIRDLLSSSGFTGICRFYTGFLYGGWLCFRG